MANDYYTHGGYPATGSQGASSSMRAELDTITAGFDKLAPLAGNAGKFLVVNASQTAQAVSSLLTETVGLLTIAGALTTTGAITSGGNVSASGAFIAAVGSVGAPSHTIVGRTDTGMWSSAIGTLDFSVGAVRGLRILPAVSGVNYFAVFPNTAGNRPGLSVEGTDTNIGMSFNAKGSGDFAWFGNGGTQLLISSAAGASRYFAFSGGSNEPTVSIGGGGSTLRTLAGWRVTNTGGAHDVTVKGVMIGFDKVGFADPSRAVNDKYAEILWDSGVWQFRYLNDAYAAAANVMTATGGFATGLTLGLYSGAGAETLRLSGTNLVLPNSAGQQIQWSGVSGFYVSGNVGAGNPGVNFDSGDFIDYVRATNLMRFTAAGGAYIFDSGADSGLGKLQVGASVANIADLSTSAAGASYLRVRNTGAQSALLALQNSTTGTATSDGFQLGIDSAGVAYVIQRENAALEFHTNNTLRMSITAGGTIQDAGGLELGYRDMPRVTGGIERGKAFATSAGFTLNTGSAAGSSYAVYNDSGSNITITQGGGLTLRLHGSATTGNRTLLARGWATIWFNSTTEAIVMGDVT